METFLNILANLSIYVLNKVFEIKYLIKSYFIKNYHVDTVINDIYFINTRTKSILEINNDFVKNINNKLIYTCQPKMVFRRLLEKDLLINGDFEIQKG